MIDSGSPTTTMRYAFPAHSIATTTDCALQGRVGGSNPSTFTPQTIGNSSDAQRAWLSSILPNLDNSSLNAVQDAYTAETFGTLQLATDLM